MLVDNCDFPDDLYFDVENDVWFRTAGSGGRAGISTILLFLARKISKVKLNTELADVDFGKRIGTIESTVYFGAIRSPVSGRISKFNSILSSDTRALLDSPYGDGWVAEYQSFDKASLAKLYFGENAKERLEARIRELKVKCFKLLPDEQIVSIGSECTTTLANLNEMLSKNPIGYVVHLATDDPVSPLEMVRWSQETKNELVEKRKEGNLYHFIVKKTRERNMVKEGQ